MTTRGSVLVVDDNDDNRELIAEYLRMCGFTVVEASNGADAVISAETHLPSVILMDLAMPGLIDGWEATRMIRRRPLAQTPAIIAVTAHSFRQYHELARHAGCRAVVVKPLDLNALAILVEQMAAHRTPAVS
jgi:CheY-like chemotaxis protein